jgi:hypothetical protein
MLEPRFATSASGIIDNNDRLFIFSGSHVISRPDAIAKESQWFMAQEDNLSSLKRIVNLRL